jgi:hypothetical protein
MTYKTPSIPMDLTPPEVKLVLRLRQLRRGAETSVFMVTTNPLSLSVMGRIEMLEVCASGSFG